jgi:hypothetical protein
MIWRATCLTREENMKLNSLQLNKILEDLSMLKSQAETTLHELTNWVNAPGVYIQANDTEIPTFGSAIVAMPLNDSTMKKIMGGGWSGKYLHLLFKTPSSLLLDVDHHNGPDYEGDLDTYYTVYAEDHEDRELMDQLVDATETVDDYGHKTIVAAKVFASKHGTNPYKILKVMGYNGIVDHTGKEYGKPIAIFFDRTGVEHSQTFLNPQVR